MKRGYERTDDKDQMISFRISAVQKQVAQDNIGILGSSQSAVLRNLLSQGIEANAHVEEWREPIGRKIAKAYGKRGAVSIDDDVIFAIIDDLIAKAVFERASLPEDAIIQI